MGNDYKIFNFFMFMWLIPKWEIPFCISLSILMSRFIPMRVGNTSSFLAGIIERAVHPYECGKYSTSGTNFEPVYSVHPYTWEIQLSMAWSWYIPNRESFDSSVKNDPSLWETDLEAQ